MDYAALNYVCPFCQAGVGQLCKTRSGKTTYQYEVHGARSDLIPKGKRLADLVNTKTETPKTKPTVKVEESTLTKIVIVAITDVLDMPVQCKGIKIKYLIHSTDKAVLVQHPTEDLSAWIPISLIHETEINPIIPSIVWIEDSFKVHWK